tara:strand:- start:592 stop:780 length:189 start_codon:yes stop_codon:yes gene_type:complete
MSPPMWRRIKNLFSVRSVVEEQKPKKFNPWKRTNSDKMTDKEKMDKGFNEKTYSINGIDVDF